MYTAPIFIRLGHHTKPLHLIAILVLTLAWGAGCASRSSGQVEIFGIDEQKGTLSHYSDGEANASRGEIADFNDPVRSNDDVVTILLESAFLENLPVTLTGSHDVIIFCDVWENAAAGYNTPALTSIVYIGANQKVPGKLNFRDAIAYGPTNFKGHPLRMRISAVVLQKSQSEKDASVVDVISAIASAAAPEYAPITGTVATTIEGILRSQPDVKFFDFEVTLCSDKPEGLVDPIVPPGVAAQAEKNVAPLNVAAPVTTDKVQWFRYGRFAMAETESYYGTKPIAGFDTPTSIVCRDSRLWYDNGTLTPVPTSYVIVRVLPKQLSEQSAVLRAASQANTTLIQSLSRSDADIAAALKSIKDSTATLSDQVLRAKAESLASKLAAAAEAKSRKDQSKPATQPATNTVDIAKVRAAGLDAIKTQFIPEWTKIVNQLAAADQAHATDIGKSVQARWQSKYGDTSATPPAPPVTATDQLTNPTTVQTIAGNLKTANPIIVNGASLQITNVTFAKSTGATLSDTANVTLALTGTPTATMKLADLPAKLLDPVNSAVNSVIGVPKQITTVTITNPDDVKALATP